MDNKSNTNPLAMRLFDTKGQRLYCTVHIRAEMGASTVHPKFLTSWLDYVQRLQFNITNANNVPGADVTVQSNAGKTI